MMQIKHTESNTHRSTYLFLGCFIRIVIEGEEDKNKQNKRKYGKIILFYTNLMD